MHSYKIVKPTTKKEEEERLSPQKIKRLLSET